MKIDELINRLIDQYDSHGNMECAINIGNDENYAIAGVYQFYKVGECLLDDTEFERYIDESGYISDGTEKCAVLYGAL